jgi:hypothetical protein
MVGAFTAIWSPRIIAELNRVLAWRWITDRTGNDLSRANEQRCSQAATIMMTWLLPVFEVVTPLPPYPQPWPTLKDSGDYPIWAAAVIGNARFVISENTRHFPPRQADGRYAYQGIEYVQGQAFLDRLLAGIG